MGIFAFCRRHWKLLTTLTIVALPSAALGWWLFTPEKPEVIHEEARRGDLVQTVEAVGTVISEKDLKLRFPVTGVVADVFVDEGDAVMQGQELARLQSAALEADRAAAAARLASENAAYQELLEGTRPEDIAIAEADTENKRAALASARAAYESAEEKLATAGTKLSALRQEAATAMQGYSATAESTAAEKSAVARIAVTKLDDVFGENVLNIAIKFQETINFENVRRQQRRATENLNAVARLLDDGFGDFRASIGTLQELRNVIADVASAVSQAYALVSGLPLSGDFNYSTREGHKTTLATQSVNAQDTLSSIDSTIKTIRDAFAGFETKIAAEEHAVATAEGARETALADIATYKAALRSQEAELLKKRTGARQTELQAARARVNQAAAELSRAKAKLEDATLRAPIDGTITKVNLKAGEFTGGLDIAEYSFSMLGATPYRVEMFVAEIDIPKVQYAQTGAIDLDAFPDEPFTIHVSEIDPTATDRDGVPKYRVKLDLSAQDARLKIGMTGDAEIFTDSREDVVIIPGRAVYAGEDGKDAVRILKNGEIGERRVTMGMEGREGETEVIFGIGEGETVILLIKE